MCRLMLSFLFLFSNNKPMPCHVYISLSKRRPKAPKRSHSSLEVYPSLKSLAQSLRGVAAISSCVADLLHGLWHIAEGPPKRVVSSQTAAAQLSHTEKPRRATYSELSSAGTGQILASNVSARYLGYLCLTLQPFLSNRALLNLHLRL